MKKWLLLVVAGIVFVGGVVLVMARSAPNAEQKTLASLKQIDEFPLYEMHVYHDYNFRRFLQQGGGYVPETISNNQPGSQSWGCTGFAALAFSSDRLFGRNFDWYQHPAMILFTDPPDGYASVSMVDISYLGYGEKFPEMSERQALLRAPYLPFDGMNEAGLAVGMMAVDQAQGGKEISKMALEDLEVIRLLLDYAGNVDEAIDLLSHYNVIFGNVPLHYMIADRQGNSAVFEFIDDQMHVLRNQNPWQVATNFILSEEKPLGATSSCWRYNTAYKTLEKTGGGLSEQQAMDLLAQVSQPSLTIWSMVYNLSSGEVSVVVDRHYDRIYNFKIGD